MIICVTGPMAAGKNYVCSQFEEKGWISLDADKLAHKAIDKNEEQILTAFSKEASQSKIDLKKADGKLNRKALGKLVFSSPKLLARQESIIYPTIIEETKTFIQTHRDSDIILNATVLYKTPELLSMCEKIIFVTAPILTRLFRALKRDKLSAMEILKRFHAQKNLLSKYEDVGIPIEIYKNY